MVRERVAGISERLTSLYHYRARYRLFVQDSLLGSSWPMRNADFPGHSLGKLPLSPDGDDRPLTTNLRRSDTGA